MLTIILDELELYWFVKYEAASDLVVVVEVVVCMSRLLWPVSWSNIELDVVELFTTEFIWFINWLSCEFEISGILVLLDASDCSWARVKLSDVLLSTPLAISALIWLLNCVRSTLTVPLLVIEFIRLISWLICELLNKEGMFVWPISWLRLGSFPIPASEFNWFKLFWLKSWLRFSWHLTMTLKNWISYKVRYTILCKM